MNGRAVRSAQVSSDAPSQKEPGRKPVSITDAELLHRRSSEQAFSPVDQEGLFCQAELL